MDNTVVEVEFDVKAELTEETQNREDAFSKGNFVKEDAEANIYHNFTGLSENQLNHMDKEDSQNYKDTSTGMRQKLRLYRIISLALFIICVVLLIVVFALIAKLVKPSEIFRKDLRNFDRECEFPVRFAPSQRERQTQRPTQPSLHFGCDNDWLRFEGSCYLFSDDRHTWQGSRDECKKKGGDLAIIANDRVQKVLTEKGTMDYWIGLNEVRPNEWMWVNNSVLNKSYWQNGFPDGDCTVLDSYKPFKKNWRTTTCAINLFYICQKM